MAIVNGQRLQQDPRTPRVTARVVVKLRAGAPPPGSALARFEPRLVKMAPGGEPAED